MAKCHLHMNDEPCSMCKVEQESKGSIVYRFYAKHGKVVGVLGLDGTFTNIRYCQIGPHEELLGKRPDEIDFAW